MRFTELQPLMHAVLDGEASPDEAAELERRLRASPEARAEFEQLRRLFDDLASVPRRHPPEGLVAAVQAALPGVSQRGGQAIQLSPASRVLGAPAGGIDVGEDGPLEQQHQPRPPQRSLPMTQPHPPYSARRKAMIGGGIAVVAALIVWQFGFDSTIRSEDVAGTVVPAQRYRAPQGTTDIKLGDQSLAQLMQDDAFVRLIRDPQVQAMVREPGFAEAARLLRSHPEVARLMLVHAESGKRLLAAPDLAKAMEANAEAALVAERAAMAAAALQASPEAQKVLAEHRELARYVTFLAAMERKSGGGQVEYLGMTSTGQMEIAALDKRVQQVEADKKVQQIAADKRVQQVTADRLFAGNLEQAQRVAERAMAAEKKIDWRAMEKLAPEHAALQKFMLANHDLARVSAQHVEAARALQASADAAQLVAMDARVARILMFNPEVARVVAQSPDAMRAVLAYPEATKALLAAPEASRHLLQSPDAARMAMQNVAERATTERAAVERAAADRAHKGDRAYNK